MTASFDSRIERAKAVPIEQELGRRGIKLNGKTNREGPCPRCGGTDRFSINTHKKLWNCRGCNVGGDIIELEGVHSVAHVVRPLYQAVKASHVGRCASPEALNTRKPGPDRLDFTQQHR